jgi:glycogen debranching enzyme GlgX
VTAVELLPIAASIDELDLVRRGLRNYWGYNPLSFFAVQPELAAPGGIASVVDAVDRLHAAGIEVILDVVFNHTAEGNHLGPTLSLRGLDNAVYYRLDPDDASRYRDFTGCGNTLAAHEPATGELILSALRWWAHEVGVDGFRFDLASAIARDADGRFDAGVDWLRRLRDDPVLADRKLIAESWDCTASGHRVGGFPAGFAEWNDRYRDTVRRFWRGDPMAGDLATRLVGSPDLFGAPDRGPFAGVAFVTAHDGFTLADLVSYRHKHNHANGEHNRDGTDGNLSDNAGVEGPTDEPAILRRRQRRIRAMLATLMLTRAVPMLRGGDEFGDTQQGNNNAYCQDNPVGWTQWPGAHRLDRLPWPAGEYDLTAFVGRLTRLREVLEPLRVGRFPDGRPREPDGLPDLSWLREDGSPMAEPDWHDRHRQRVAMRLVGSRAAPHAPGDGVYVAFNAGEHPATFALPATGHASGWVCVLDTAEDAVPNGLAPKEPADHSHAAGGAWLRVDGPGIAVCVAGPLLEAALRAVAAGRGDDVLGGDTPSDSTQVDPGRLR